MLMFTPRVLRKNQICIWFSSTDDIDPNQAGANAMWVWSDPISISDADTDVITGILANLEKWKMGWAGFWATRASDRVSKHCNLIIYHAGTREIMIGYLADDIIAFRLWLWRQWTSPLQWGALEDARRTKWRIERERGGWRAGISPE